MIKIKPSNKCNFRDYDKVNKGIIKNNDVLIDKQAFEVNFKNADFKQKVTFETYMPKKILTDLYSSKGLLPRDIKKIIKENKQ